MAILQKLLRSALCCERSLLVSPSRCASGLQSHWKSPPNTSSFFHNDNCSQEETTTSQIKSVSTCSSVLKPTTYSLLQRIDSLILPMSPAEQLVRLQLPAIIKEISLEMPTTKASLDNAHINQKVIEIKTPQRGRVIEQLAIRMLVIRRRKMKKHQRKKFLKKFRVHLMTLHRKRDAMKETIFLSGLEQEMKTAEAFDVQKYAAEKIRKAYTPLPQKEALVKPLPWEFRPLFYNSQKKGDK